MGKQRINTVDFIRGLCILLMIFDHILFFTLRLHTHIWGSDGYNLLQQGILDLANLAFNTELHIVRDIIRGIVLFAFFAISGFCCSLSRNNLHRAVRIGIYAIIITVVSIVLSKVFDMDLLILWGVLHCYGVCIIVYHIFRNAGKKYCIALCAVFLAAMFVITYLKPSINTWVLIPLGIPGKEFTYSIEYFPVLKWIGIFFIGVIIGKFYADKKSEITEIKRSVCLTRYIKYSLIMNIGRRGALAYFAHFPVLIGFLYLINLF